MRVDRFCPLPKCLAVLVEAVPIALAKLSWR